MAFRRPKVGSKTVPKEVGTRKKKKGIGGFLDANTNIEREKRPDEIVDLLELTEDFQQIRIMPTPIGVYSVMWIEILTQKGGKIRIPKPTPNFDPNTDTLDETIDNPYMEIPNDVQTSKHYYVNVLVRSEQDNEPKRTGKPTIKEAKSGHKRKGSGVWTPVKVMRIPSSAAATIKKLATANKHKVNGKVRAFELSHPKYGKDLMVAFDDSRAGPDKYMIQQDEPSALTPTERKYLVWDVSNLMSPESPESAAKEAKALAERAPSAPQEVSATEAEDLLADDDELVETPKPRRKRVGTKTSPSAKTTTAKKRRVRRTTADSEEDETPVRRRRRKTTATSSTTNAEPKRRRRRRTTQA